MTGFTWLLQNSLFYGAILSLLLTIVIVASGLFNPEIWINDYPPDIRARYGPVGTQTKKQQSVVSILFLLVLLGVLGFSTLQLFRASAGRPGFGALLLNTWLPLLLFNLVDLLIIDWLIVVRLRPRSIVLPGTEGLPGYSDYGYHFKGFLTGLAATFLVSLALAGIVALAVKLIG